MKYLLVLSILIAALLLTPATVLGQVYAYPSIGYDQYSNYIYAHASLSYDYYTLYYYGIPSMDLFISDSCMYVGGGPWYPSPNDAYAEAPATPGTTYYAIAETWVTYPYPVPYDYCEAHPMDCEYYYWYIYAPEYIMYACDGWYMCYEWQIDSFATWITAYNEQADYAVSGSLYVPESAPDGENSYYASQWSGPNPDPPNDMLYGSNYYVQLTDNGNIPPIGKYAGRTVTESFNGMTDTCYQNYQGPYQLPSPVPRGSWNVDNNNIYGYDTIAANYEWINWYTNYYHAWTDCYAEVQQTMSISSFGPYNSHPMSWHVYPISMLYEPTRDSAGIPYAWPGFVPDIP